MGTISNIDVIIIVRKPLPPPGGIPKKRDSNYYLSIWVPPNS